MDINVVSVDMTNAGLVFLRRGTIGSDQLFMRNLADVSWTHHLRNQSMPVGSRSLPVKVDVTLNKLGP